MSMAEQILERIGGENNSRQFIEASFHLGRCLATFEDAAHEAGRAKWATHKEVDNYMKPHRDKVLSAIEQLVLTIKKSE